MFNAQKSAESILNFCEQEDVVAFQIVGNAEERRPQVLNAYFSLEEVHEF